MRTAVRAATSVALILLILQMLAGLSAGAQPASSAPPGASVGNPSLVPATGEDRHRVSPPALVGHAVGAYPGPDPTSTPPGPEPTSTPNGGYPGPPTNTPIPTSTPTPTPVVLSLREVRPREGRNDVTTPLEIFGVNLPEHTQAQLEGTGSISVSLRTIFVSSEHLAAKVPRGLAPGVYDVSVSGDGQSDTLAEAYRVLAATSLDDLRADPFRLWTNPPAPREGVTITLGLVVDRLGGQTGLSPVEVRFYAGKMITDTIIGYGIVPSIGINDSRSTSAVEWGMQPAGTYAIWAQIDPANVISETNETNNVISRTVTVQEREADSTPPTVQGLLVNGEASQTSSRAIALTVTATDNVGGSGVAKVLYVELHWNPGAQSWVPVQWTDWLPYGGDHHWTLHPESGVRYIQAWAADRAGNVSVAARKARINYVPASETLAQGETRVYRVRVEAGQCLTVLVEPQSGDPDLYVWPPGYQTPDEHWPKYSLNGEDQADQVQFTALESGVYQVEVEGYTQATYRLTITVSDSCGLSVTRALASDGKTPREQPVVPLSSEPPGQLAMPELPAATYALYLPMINKAYSPGAERYRIYLPIIFKGV